MCVLYDMYVRYVQYVFVCCQELPSLYVAKAKCLAVGVECREPYLFDAVDPSTTG